MTKTVSKQSSPVILGVVRKKYADDAILAIKNCKLHGATAIDLHLSCLLPEERTLNKLKSVVSSTDLPILAVNYDQNHDRSEAGMSEEERTALLLLGVEAGCAGADIQGYTFDISARTGVSESLKGSSFGFARSCPREIVADSETTEKQKELIHRIHEMGGEVLMSCHPGAAMTAEQLTELISFLENREPDIIKIVVTADTEEELAEVIRAMILIKSRIKTPVSLHASGKYGNITRLINPLLGSHIIFGVDGYSRYDDTNQLDIESVTAIMDRVKRLFELR